MRRSLRTLALIALWLPIAGSLAAQHRGLRPVDRSGSEQNSFWAVVGIAQGKETYRFDYDSTWSDPFTSNSLFLSAGGMVATNFGVGFEWNVWADYDASSDQKLQALSLVGNWYPGNSVVFLKGGVGLGFNRIDDGSGVFRDTGVGATLGIGVDIPIARSVAIEPRADYYIQRYNSPGQANDYQERLTQIGVAVRFR